MTRSGRAIDALFLASGATGLAYEVLWARALSGFMGNDALARAIVLAAFLGGMALGYAVLGARADQTRRPLRAYAMLEGGVAAWALAFPVLVALAGAIAAAVGHTAGGAGAAQAIAEIALAFALLAPPTFLMGGALPMLVRHLATGLADVGSATGRLYGLNALGGVAGALVGEFLLVPAIGITGATWLVAGVSAGVAAIAWRLGAAEAPAPVAEAEDGGEALDAAGRAAAVAIAGASGLAALIYEVAWLRLVALAMGASVYSFGLMLATFVAGIGAGGLIAMRIRASGRALLWWLGGAQLGTAIAVAATLPWLERLPYAFVALRAAIAPISAGPAAQEAGKLLLCAAMMFLPAVGLGISLPLAARAATPRLAEAGTRVGRAFAANAGGNVVGATTTASIVLPTIGLQGALALGAAINLVAGAVAWALAGRGLARWAATPAVALGVAIVALTPPWDPRHLSSAVARMRPGADAPTSWAEFDAHVGRRQVMFHRDDVQATIDVLRRDEDVSLMVNGKADASTGGDMPTQVLLGHVPLVLAPQAKRALVIGLGSGITPAAMLTHPIAELEVVEISPAVVTASQFFAAHHGASLDDARVRFVVDDALSHLAATGGSYDVIVSEPSNPWIAGVGNLFSAEFLARCADRLAPGGVMTQWLPTYEMDDATVALAVRTFVATFPETRLWRATRGDMVMVGRKRPGDPAWADAAARLATPAVAADLARVGLTRPTSFFALELAGPRGAAALAGSGPLNTLDRPLLEYQAPLAFMAGASAKAVDGIDARLGAAGDAALGELALGRYLQARGRPLAPDELAELVRYARERAHAPGLAAAWTRRWAAAYPADDRATEALAGALQVAGRPDDAEPLVARLLARRPRDLAVVALATQVAFDRIARRGATPEAKALLPAFERRAALLGVLRAGTGEAWIIRARAYLLLGEPVAAAEALDRAEADAPMKLIDPGAARYLAALWWEVAQAASRGGRNDLAKSALERAEAIARGHGAGEPPADAAP